MRRPLFSIGAVSRMLELAPATIRTWEVRYGLVSPERSQGGQRLYSREQVEQLRFVKGAIARGSRPAEAHRLLRERIARGDAFEPPRPSLLLAVAGDADAAARAFEALSPAAVALDPGDTSFAPLAERVRAMGTPIIPLEVVADPGAWPADAKALHGP
jgi:DNA-binding transcriptional MerR regulator